METGGLKGISEKILTDLEQRQSGLSKPRREGLALLVSCMLSEQTPNLMVLASALPRQIGSNEKRYQYISRFLGSDKVEVASVMRGYVLQLCQRLTQSGEQLVLMLDQSKVGKGFEVLMLSVRVDQRALPVLWTVQQTRGAIGFAKQRCLLEAVVQMLPASPVVLMADRFYGTPALVEWCQTHQWCYRIRLKGNLVFQHLGGDVTGKDAASWGMRALNQATFNNSAIQTNIGIVHEATHEEPWIIAMDCPASEYKALDYSWRWGIEAMFSDFKSRGFDLPRTQLQHAERIERLILVMSLALYWATSAGITDPAASPRSQKNASAPSVPSLQQGYVLSSELSAMLCQFSLSGYPGNLRGGEPVDPRPVDDNFPPFARKHFFFRAGAGISVNDNLSYLRSG